VQCDPDRSEERERGERRHDQRDREQQRGRLLQPCHDSTWAAYWSPTDPNGEIVYTADAVSFQPHSIYRFICTVLKPDVDVPTP
jgi:hypothetical protein